jgi:DNA-binding MarR family transcriptional regulator
MAVYPETQNGTLTGVWIAETKVLGKRVRSRFATQEEAEHWMDRIHFARQKGVEAACFDDERADADSKQPSWMTVHPEKRNGRLTKRWIAEAQLYGKRVRSLFDTLKEGKQWRDAINNISAHEIQLKAKEMDTLPSTTTTLSDDGKRVMRNLQAALEPFRSVRPPMLFEHVWTFLMVAVDEGRSVGEYAERANVSMSVMSRYLLDLAARNSLKEEGCGLIESKPIPTELRKKEVHLTTQGHALAEALIRNWQT